MLTHWSMNNNAQDMQFCQAFNVGGTHKCQSCFKWLITWSGWKSGPKRCPESSRTRADQRRAGRSNFGNLKDAAQTQVGIANLAILPSSSIQDRMEGDPYYLLLPVQQRHSPNHSRLLSVRKRPCQIASPRTWAEQARRGRSSWQQVSAHLSFSCQMKSRTSGSLLTLDVT